MTVAIGESVVEDAALGWLVALGCPVLYESDIAAGKPAAERRDLYYPDAVLEQAEVLCGEVTA